VNMMTTRFLKSRSVRGSGAMTFQKPNKIAGSVRFLRRASN
jgi:hypothetical protein